MSLRFDLKTMGLDATIQKIGALSGLTKRARNSALKSCGFMVQQEIKSEMKRGGRSLGWQPPHPITKILKERQTATNLLLSMQARRKRKKRGWSFLTTRQSEKLANSLAFARQFSGGIGGKLVNAITYSVYDDSGRAVVGIIPGSHAIGKGRSISTGTKAEWLLNKIQEGGSLAFPKNEKTRRLFAALGFPIKSSTQLTRTARPLFAPMLQKLRSSIKTNFEQKFHLALARYIAGNNATTTFTRKVA